MVVVSSLATVTSADPPPKKAKRYKAALVQHYEECVEPYTHMTGPFPACTPVPSNPDCSWEPGRGRGQATVTVTRSDVEFRARLTNLAANCEGDRLCIRATIRTTTDGCVGPTSRCTRAEFPFYFGCALVTDGRWLVKTSIDEIFGSPAAQDLAQNSQVTEPSIVNVTDGSVPNFAVGIFIP